jgi:hypothetical protein
MSERRERVRFHRTDLEGTITIASDGKKLEVRTERATTASARYSTGDALAGKPEAAVRGSARGAR